MHTYARARVDRTVRRCWPSQCHRVRGGPGRATVIVIHYLESIRLWARSQVVFVRASKHNPEIHRLPCTCRTRGPRNGIVTASVGKTTRYHAPSTTSSNAHWHV